MAYSTRKLIAALVASAATATVLALGITCALDYRGTRHRLERDLDQRTQLAAEHLKTAVRTNAMLLGRVADYVASHPLVGLRGSNADQSALRAMVSEAEGVDSVWIYDEHGDAVLSTSTGDIRGFNVADRPYFRRAKAGEAMVISPLIWGRVTGGGFFSVARRLEDASGQFRGVALAGIPATHFAEFYARVAAGEDAIFAVRNLDGDLVVRYPLPMEEPSPGWPERAVVRDRLAVAPEGVFEHASPVDGLERVSAYRRIEGLNLVIITGRSTTTLYANWRARTITVGAFGGFGLLMTLAIAQVAMRRARREADQLRDALQDAKEQAERFDLAVAATDDGIWDWDFRTNTVTRTAKMKALYGFADDEMGNNPQEFWDRVHPDDLPGLRAVLKDHLERRLPQAEVEARVRHRDGSWRWVLVRGLAQFAPDGSARRMVGMISDVTERKEQEARLMAEREAAEEERERARHAANHDALTGLPNRAGFEARLDAMAADDRRRDSRAIVMMLDLDGFKEVNDRFGHHAGDIVLMGVAERLRHCLRGGDSWPDSAATSLPSSPTPCAKRAPVGHRRWPSELSTRLVAP